MDIIWDRVNPHDCGGNVPHPILNCRTEEPHKHTNQMLSNAQQQSENLIQNMKTGTTSLIWCETGAHSKTKFDLR